MDSRLGTDQEFRGVAELLSERVAELLSAPVVVKDGKDCIVAASRPKGSAMGLEEIGDDPNHLFIPVQLDGQTAKVVVAPPTTGEVISPRLAKAAVHLVIDEASVLERLQPRQHAKNKFIFDLLQGEIKDQESLLRQAKFLSLDLNPPRAVILIDSAEFVVNNCNSDDDAPKQRRAQLLIDSIVEFFQLPNDTICAHLGGGEIAVLKASDTKNLSSWTDGSDGAPGADSLWANLSALKRAGGALLARLRNDTGTSISVGIGRYHAGLDGLAKSYQDAKLALSLGRRFHGVNRVHCLDQLGIPSFVAVPDEKIKVDLAAHLLGPLDDEPEMLQTLEVFFAQDCCSTATADRLAIHRNTLRYRLEKVCHLTGLDPYRFDDAVVIRLSLLLRAMR